MVTYVCLGVLFLFVSFRLLVYYFRRKRVPEPEQLDQLVITTLRKGKRERL